MCSAYMTYFEIAAKGSCDSLSFSDDIVRDLWDFAGYFLGLLVNDLELTGFGQNLGKLRAVRS